MQLLLFILFIIIIRTDHQSSNTKRSHSLQNQTTKQNKTRFQKKQRERKNESLVIHVS